MYKPVFVGPIEGYVVNQLKEHYWKVERTLSREEVLQEAHECFLRCCRRFPKSKAYNTPQAFMALFKQAWFNQFTDLANYDTKHRACVSVESREIKLEEPAGSRRSAATATNCSTGCACNSGISSRRNGAPGPAHSTRSRISSCPAA